MYLFKTYATWLVQMENHHSAQKTGVINFQTHYSGTLPLQWASGVREIIMEEIESIVL